MTYSPLPTLYERAVIEEFVLQLPSELSEWPMKWGLSLSTRPDSPWLLVHLTPCTPHPVEAQAIKLGMLRETAKVYREMADGAIGDDELKPEDIPSLVMREMVT